MNIEQTTVTIKTDNVAFLLTLIEFLKKTEVPKGSTVIRFDSLKEKVMRS